ncbi:MAG: type II secretory protein [Zestosphaera tikiterensis]|uniref:Type II secretory protein n=1 Tax=Zestosphaera tikiterensis TaxID=1973259 RepID=A0A2R7Y5L3_9CREN|nr:MAG: type II secretory protein [Zestosphaera tikiterensis]
MSVGEALRTLAEYKVSPYVSVVIFEGADAKLRYHVREPPLNETTLEILKHVLNRIYSDVDLIRRFSEVKSFDEALHEAEEVIQSLLKRKWAFPFKHFGKRLRDVSDEDLGSVAYYLARDLSGYGVLDPLLRDPHVEDITCDGVEIPVYVFHDMYEWLETNVVFTDVTSLEKVVRRLALRSGQEPTVARPIVEGVLRPEGYRVHIVLDVVSRRGHSFSIRKFRETPFTISELISRGTLDPAVAALLWLAIENKQGIVIYGPTGSGKTTLLNALTVFLPPEAKIVSAEDTPEIFLPFHENWMSMVTRLSVNPLIQDVNLQTQLESAMRQRPDVLILGEIRSREAYAFFQGVSTGHGGLTTVHAESLESLVRRLYSPPMSVPKSLIATAKLFVQTLRLTLRGEVVRKVTLIHETSDYNPSEDLITFKVVVKWFKEDDSWRLNLRSSKLIEAIAKSSMMSYDEVLEDLSRRATILYYAAVKNVDTVTLYTLVRTYRKKPHQIYETVLKSLGSSYGMKLYDEEEKRIL